MKHSLFAAALLAIALSACTKKEETTTLPPPATLPSLPSAAQNTQAEADKPAETPAPVIPAASGEAKPAN